MSKTAVVILNWNGKHFLQHFLPGIVNNTRANSGGQAEIVIADNASTDASLSLLESCHSGIRLIKFDKNYGFAEGYNKALNRIEADYYVLLNSDVEVGSGWLAPLMDFMDQNPHVGVCMPKIKSFHHPAKFEYAGACGGFMDVLGYPFCRGRILSNIENDCGQYDTARPVFWASGTCFMIRSRLWHELQGLDRHFFAHMEEIDLCWRVQLAGHQIWVLPRSQIFHVGGGSLPNNSPHKLFLNYRNNLYMLYKNLPNSRLCVVLCCRMLLDAASALLYLLQGKPKFTAVVFKAHLAFWKTRKQLTRNPQKQKTALQGIYRGSIVAAFFLHGSRLRFSMIRDKRLQPSTKQR